MADIPMPCAPKGLRREQAAIYVGMSPSLFDQAVERGDMPRPKVYNSCVLWDRQALDAAFEALPEKPRINTWDRGRGNENAA